MSRYEIIPLWATADEEGNYLDVSNNLKDVNEWLSDKENVEATQVIRGYGVVDKIRKLMPDEAIDFHYTKEEAEKKLNFLNNKRLNLLDN